MGVDISFVILSWNSADYLRRCMDSIDRAMKRSSTCYEVRVFDNGSRDGTPGLLKQLASERPGVVFPRFETSNIGTTRSRNLLFAESRGELLCVMDCDVELAEGVVETLAALLERDKRLGLVVPRILYPSGAWQKSISHFPTLPDKIDRFIRLRSMERREAGKIQKNMPVYVDYAIAAFWLMRRDLLKTVGTLDERIFYSPEDVDFCLRVWKSGYRILYVPYVTVIHHAQEISRGLNMNPAKLSHIKGLCYYFLKHRYLLNAPKMAHGTSA
jgi:GT2 family glycosyltransferase